MLGLLQPGETLLVRPPASGERFQVGDVICFQFESAPMAVAHRVVRIIAAPGNRIAYITMGDNNDRPDWRPVPEELPTLRLLVAAQDRDGVRRSIARGAAGWRRFKRNRISRGGRRLLGKIWHRVERLVFWRMRPAKQCEFGAETVYYFCERPVARRKADGTVVFFRRYYRLFFRVPEGQKQAKK